MLSCCSNTQCWGRGGRIHTRLGCREVLFEEREGEVEVTGLRLSRAGQEQVARADAYIAALDVPGAQATWPLPLVAKWQSLEPM